MRRYTVISLVMEGLDESIIIFIIMNSYIACYELNC